MTKGLPVRLSGPSRVSLFAYDNGTFVVHSFLPYPVMVEANVDGRPGSLLDLTTGASVPAQPRGDAAAFPVFLLPHASRAFAVRPPGGAGGPSAHAFAVNQKLGRGVNIIGYDPLWKDRAQARFTDAHFAAIRDAGFTSVRINLHPFKFMSAASGYALDPSWLATLDWAVKGALANHLAVVLDLHEFHAMAEDPVGRKEMLLAFWRQVAERFKDAPDDVVFELLNEPFGKLTPEMWNGYLKEALAVVRATNPTRAVVVGPGQWNGIGALPSLVLPEDDRNLIVTVHYYTPMEFTHQGAPWAPEFVDKLGVTWTGTDQQRRRVELDFGRAQEWAAAHDRPVLLGEFGAYDKADMDSRARYTAFVARTAERLGWSWAYWQFDSDFVVYDVDTRPVGRAAAAGAGAVVTGADLDRASTRLTVSMRGRDVPRKVFPSSVQSRVRRLARSHADAGHGRAREEAGWHGVLMLGQPTVCCLLRWIEGLRPSSTPPGEGHDGPRTRGRTSRSCRPSASGTGS